MLAAAYVALAIGLTWPAAIGGVPGAERSDLWNSLWSLWLTREMLAEVLQGGATLHTELLGAPTGGVLLPADLVNGLLAAPLIGPLGLASTYTALVIGHVALSGLGAHLLARRIWGSDAPGWVAGASFAAAPVLISAVHNGTSEAIGGGLLALGGSALIGAAERGGWRVAAAGLLMAVTALGSWYMGACLWILWAAMLLAPAPGAGRLRLVAAGGLGSLLTAPIAAGVYRVAIHPENLLAIKGERELALVRRSIGAADPRGWFAPGDFRSPDFERISAYAEQFIHCHYLGWVGIAAALVAWRGAPRTGWGRALALAGFAGFVLAMGPVVVIDGFAWIIDDRLAVPLPYFLVEDLPGFSSLSLIYRLGALPALSLAAAAGGAILAPRRAAGGRPALRALILAALILAELRLASPMAGLPATQDPSLPEPLFQLAEAPPGSVINFPVVGGRAYLYEQTAHQKPLAGLLNFPINRESRKVWKAMQSADRPNGIKKAAVVAERHGVRYLVVHQDAKAAPGMYDGAVRAWRRQQEPLYADDAVEVYALW